MEAWQFFKWAKERIAERSTWDGSVIVAVSIGAFLTAPFVKYLAVAGLVYGAYRIYEKEIKE